MTTHYYTYSRKITEEWEAKLRATQIAQGINMPLPLSTFLSSIRKDII